MTENDPQELIIIESELTIQKAMNGTQIRKLDPILGRKNMIKAISYFLDRAAKNFNVGKNLTDEQTIILAIDLFEIFQYETLEDVVLMLKYARQGKIGDGKVFNLDGQTIIHKWVPAYLELKAIERENEHTKNKGNKNGLANFKWKKEDVEKLELSDKVETVKQGFGERMKEVITTPEDYKPPLQKRDMYIKLLKESSKKASRKELESSIERLKSEGKEPDALEVMENELKSRFR